MALVKWLFPLNGTEERVTVRSPGYSIFFLVFPQKGLWFDWYFFLCQPFGITNAIKMNFPYFQFVSSIWLRWQNPHDINNDIIHFYSLWKCLGRKNFNLFSVFAHFVIQMSCKRTKIMAFWATLDQSQNIKPNFVCIIFWINRKGSEENVNNGKGFSSEKITLSFFFSQRLTQPTKASLLLSDSFSYIWIKKASTFNPRIYFWYHE